MSAYIYLFSLINTKGLGLSFRKIFLMLVV